MLPGTPPGRPHVLMFIKEAGQRLFDILSKEIQIIHNSHTFLLRLAGITNSCPVRNRCSIQDKYSFDKELRLYFWELSTIPPFFALYVLFYMGSHVPVALILFRP